MGSRISRAIYRNQRATPIKKQQNEQVKGIIVYFLSFISNVFFFLFGYLFRPYLNNKNSIGIFFILLLLFVVLKIKHLNQAAFLSSLTLLVAVIISKVIGVDVLFLKATLVLTSIAISSLINFELSANTYFQAFLLWLQYECFSLGTTLSLSVQKINMEQSGVEMGKEETMLVKVLFSLIGVMVIIMISLGKRLLKVKEQDINKQVSPKNQVLQTVFSISLLVGSFVVKRETEQLFLFKLLCIGSTLFVLYLTFLLKQLSRLWIVITVITTITYLLIFLTQNDESLRYWLDLAKIINFNLAIVDGIQRWNQSIKSGTHKPFIIVFIFFTSFYVSQLSTLGITIYQQLSHKWVLDIFSIASYAFLILIEFIKTRKNYEPIVV